MKTFFSQHLFPLTVIAGAALGLALFGFLTGRFEASSPSVTADPRPVEREQPGVGLPVRLKIPSLNIDASIESVGQTPAGAMDVPQRPEDVAWYNLGARPGDAGSAVIAGHRDWFNGKAAVFYSLDKLQIGDSLSVEDDQGQSVAFVMQGSRLYDAAADAPEVFTSTGGRHLNLVTCTGIWNRLKHTYTKRLVVFAEASQ